MLMRLRRHTLLRCALGLLAGLGALAVSPQLEFRSAAAQSASAPAKASAKRVKVAKARTIAPQAQTLAKPYFIEFCARAALSYGHTFSMFGRLNARGEILSSEVAGLHPITESSIPWMIGHLVAVPSETGPSDGDTEDQYVIARFRVALSEDEYEKVTGFIRQLRARSPLWHAALYNCNAFVGDIADYMGLKVTASPLAMPQDYIDNLRDLNIGRSDLAGVIGTPVQVEDAAALRAAALRALAQKP